jgi:cytochrome b involved in lipid metabolism
MNTLLIILLILLILVLSCFVYYLICSQKNKFFEFFQTSEYSIQEIESHNTKDDLWTHLEGNVYDITKFYSQHPGGSIILKAGGKNLKSVWEENGVTWHLSNDYVKNTLEKYKIGTLQVEDL